MKFTKKEGFILAAIFILAIAGGVIWYLLEKQKTTVTEAPKQEVSQQEQPVVNEPAQPNNQEQVSEDVQPTIDTSDWKTYKNEGWNYSIKYPPTLFIRSNAQGDKFPDDESTPFDGGQTLIISDKKQMGIQDIMPDESIHLTIITEKRTTNQSLLENKKSYYQNLESGYDDGNTKENNKILINTLNELTIETHKHVKSWPYGGSWEGKNVKTYTYCRYLVKNNWIYNICGSIYTFGDNQELNNKRDIIRSIILSFIFSN